MKRALVLRRPADVRGVLTPPVRSRCEFASNLYISQRKLWEALQRAGPFLFEKVMKNGTRDLAITLRLKAPLAEETDGQ
jgi:hypothetical protein